MSGVGETPTEGDLDDVFEVELDFIGRQSVGKSLERPLQPGFEIFDNGNKFLNSRFVNHTARSIDEQTDVFVELNVRRKFHSSFTGDNRKIRLRTEATVNQGGFLCYVCLLLFGFLLPKPNFVCC